MGFGSYLDDASSVPRLAPDAKGVSVPIDEVSRGESCSHPQHPVDSTGAPAKFTVSLIPSIPGKMGELNLN
jgi:hypothetical protein